MTAKANPRAGSVELDGASRSVAEVVPRSDGKLRCRRMECFARRSARVHTCWPKLPGLKQPERVSARPMAAKCQAT